MSLFRAVLLPNIIAAIITFSIITTFDFFGFLDSMNKIELVITGVASAMAGLFIGYIMTKA